MNKFKIELKWAIIFTIMMIVWMYIEKLAGLHDKHIDLHPIFTNFIAIPAIIVYVFALIDKRNNYYNGVMTYMQGFISGLILTLIVTIFSPLVQYLTSVYITPDYFENVINYSVNEGLMSQAEAEDYFNLNSYLIQVLIGTPIMGIATTAIVAIFTRKK
ncbi:MAG: DUF4199 domain-containing protein [Bacteroidota bacterium]